MDLAHDERVTFLHDRIQQEQAPHKLSELVRELTVLIDSLTHSSPPDEALSEVP